MRNTHSNEPYRYISTDEHQDGRLELFMYISDTLKPTYGVAVRSREDAEWVIAQCEAWIKEQVPQPEQCSQCGCMFTPGDNTICDLWRITEATVC